MSATAEFWLLTFARMLADAQFFDSRFGKIEGAGDFGSHIVEIVKSKAIIADPTRSQSRLSADEHTASKPSVERTVGGANGEQEKT
jgi:hypothetical protein